MTTFFLASDIARDEGLRLKAYPDPESPRAREMCKPETARCVGWQHLTGSPWTIGYGQTGPGITEGTIWTQAQATEALLDSISGVEAQLDSALPWWRQLDSVRQDVLANMGFNLGVVKLCGFHHFLEALDGGDYAKAADEMLASRWASQVKARASRLATQMRTGVRA